ncbi:MAG TPA: GGDEF domain-containing protein [Methylophaga sp.]|nr:GGDEF domain-containing protein [Methylophaga sp.]
MRDFHTNDDTKGVLMASDGNEAKLNEWKDKFFALTKTLEQQKKYDQQLERGLTRLALAANGLDEQLDTHLDSLRKALRSNQPNTNDVIATLGKIETAIGKMDEKKQASDTLVSLLSDVISQISWPKLQQKPAIKLQKKARSADQTELSVIIDELVALVEQGFVTSDETEQPSKPGFLRKLFASKSGVDAQESLELENDVATSRVSEKKEETVRENSDMDVGYQPHLLLIHLLEKLSLPTEFSKKATSIRLSIQKGIAIAELPSVINSIADLLSELGSSAVAEKKEYENFLRDLAQKITTLDKQLSQLGHDDASAFANRHLIVDDVETEMQSLRADVEEATEINILKQTLSTRIENLNQHINNYHQADSNRFEVSQKQIQALNERLKIMETEANTLKQATTQARALAMKDALTGIWNRQALNEVMETEFSRWSRYNKPLTMVVWDVDFFKVVNDNFGHTAGDIVLKTIAQIFKKATRKSDFIARFGGEEFVGLFPETSIDDALVMANNIRDTIENTQFQHSGMSVPITASAGLATFEPGDKIDDVFERADKALYKAKQQGRNNCQVGRKSS